MSTRKTSFSLPDESHTKLVDLAEQTGKSKSAVLADALNSYQQPTLPTTAPDESPVDTRFGVDPSPQLPVDTSAPLWQLWTNPYRAWNPDALLLAKGQADQGWMQYAADLWESMLGDDRVAGALEQRILASEGMPLSFVGSPRGAKKLEALWSKIMTPGLRADIFRWGMGVGVVPVYVREWVDGEPQGVEVWHPRWLRYYWWERRWKIQCLSGLVDMSSQPGRWYLFCPFGQADSRPWVTGLWYSTASWWLVKAYAIPDMANYGQTRATPKWFMEQIDGNATISKAEKAQAIRWLAAVPQRSSMYVPYPFKVEQHDSTSTGWQVYIQEVDKANAALAQRILGHDGGIEKSSTHASGGAAMGVRGDLISYDCRAETEFWRQGLLDTWSEVNAIPGDVPYPERQTTEPEDLKLVAGVQEQAAKALVALKGAGLDSDLDMRANLGRYFILRDPLTDEADDTAPDDGIQLSTSEIDDLPDTCVIRLDSRTGRAVLLSGDMGEEDTFQETTRLLLASNSNDKTNFPKHGDDKKVNLRNSQYEVFDPDYVDALKEDWPEIWKAGGNIRGNDQYRKLRPIIANGGSPDGEVEENAVRLREAWAARHYENKRLAGVVALMKWFVVGSIGTSGMKAVIEEQKGKIRERRKKKSMSWSSSDRLRDVRRHTRDGLGFRDAVTDKLLDANLGRAASRQVLDVLESATSYEDAKRRLSAALPNLDRARLRDLLSGGLLLTQAAGMLTGGREGKDK